jgi:hypothetical protein
MKADKSDKDSRRREAELLEILRKESCSLSDFKHLICVRSTSTPKGVKRMTAAQIAYLLMIRPQSVLNIRSTYRKKGLKAIIDIGVRGGRRRQNLSIAREQTLIRRSCAFDKLYGSSAITVKTLKINYRKATGKQPINPTIYRLLKRHGCHRIAKGMYSPPKPIPVP